MTVTLIPELNIKKDKGLSLEEVFSTIGRVKILELLAIEEELNISEIIKRTGLNHTTVLKHLDYYIGINFVQEKQFGRIKIYRFKAENPKARALKNLLNVWRDLP